MFILFSCGQNQSAAIYDNGDFVENYYIGPYALEPIEPLPTDTNYDAERKPAFFESSCSTPTSFAEYLYYEKIIDHLGGRIHNPLSRRYSESKSGLNKFLKDIGVKNFKAKEIVASSNPSSLKACGLKDLLPPKHCWLRTASLLLMAEQIRKDLGEKIVVSSHYRPQCYNDLIGGASKSDHILAKAIDLVPIDRKNKSNKYRREFIQRVQDYVCDTFWFDPDLRLSAGFGEKQLHIGIDSPRIRNKGLGRVWTYPNYDLSQDISDPNNPIRFLEDGAYRRCFYNENDIFNSLSINDELDI